jgi:hypothetical protein
VSSEDDQPDSDHASRAANQSKTEPMPSTQGHADPDAAPAPATVEVPALDSMSVGAGDPQAPSHDSAGGHGDRGRSGVPALDTPVLKGGVPAEQRPAAATGSSTGRADGPVQPEQDSDGAARRQPGSLGHTADDEQIETDVERSAQNTNVRGTPGTSAGPGDTYGVPVVSDEAAPGTSEESSVAQGPRTPR